MTSSDATILDSINDLADAKTIIISLKHDKEALEQEVSTIKEKAINQIIAKEK